MPGSYWNLKLCDVTCDASTQLAQYITLVTRLLLVVYLVVVLFVGFTISVLEAMGSRKDVMNSSTPVRLHGTVSATTFVPRYHAFDHSYDFHFNFAPEVVGGCLLCTPPVLSLTMSKSLGNYLFSIWAVGLPMSFIWKILMIF